MPLPELDLHRIQTFAEERVPARARTQVRMEVYVRGSIVTLYELRAPRYPKYGPAWTRSAIASLRYSPTRRRWTLFWMDHNGRWHRYGDSGPTPTVSALLAELDHDPTGVFWE